MPTTGPILILDSDARAIEAALAEAGDAAIETLATDDLDRAAAEAGDAEIVFGSPELVAAALPRLPNVRWVQSTWAGVRPLLPAMRRDPELVVTGVKGIFGPLMTEYVLGYLIAVERRLVDYVDQQRDGCWRPLDQGRLAGRRMTVLGLGDIGCAVARGARALGMEVRGVTRSGRSPCPDVAAATPASELVPLARRTDVLVSILPDVPDARGMVDASVIEALPRDAVLVNVGRGAAVDDDALVRALEAGRLKAAVLDVFDEEPLPADHPLWSAPRTFVTPHVAAVTLPEDIAGLFLDNLERYRAGERPRYRVDPERGY